MDSNLLHIGCDENVFYDEAVTRSGTALGTGTCTWELTTVDGTSLGSGTLGAVPGQAGFYLGIIESDVTDLLEEGVTYILVILFHEGAFNDERRFECEAVYRGSE